MNEPAPRSSDAQIAPRWLLLLACYFGLQPASVDMYLAALPRLVDSFASTPAAVQLTLSVFIASFATAQLLVGPLSDRYGRRPVCLYGLMLATTGATLAALAPSLTLLVLARFLQALGVCSVVVCARAIVRDQYEPHAGAQVLSKVLSWMTLAPFLSPIVGGVVLHFWGWRACFAVMAALSLFALIACWRWQGESNSRLSANALKVSHLWRNYRSFLASREYVNFMLMLLGSYCAMFSFISVSSYVLIRVIGLPEFAYGFAFAFVTLGFLSGTIALRRLMPVGGLPLVLASGAWLAFTGGVLMLALALLGVHTLAAVVLPMFLVVCGHGLLQPACQMGAATPFPDQAGAAAALIGFTMHVGAASVGWLLSRHVDSSSLPMAFAIALSTTFILLIYWLRVRPMLSASAVVAANAAVRPVSN